MAMQAFRVYDSPLEGSFVDLIYDDVAMTCGQVRVVNPATAKPLLVEIDLPGRTVSRTAKPGTNVTVNLPITVNIISGVGRGGQPTLSFQGMNRVHFSHG